MREIQAIQMFKSDDCVDRRCICAPGDCHVGLVQYQTRNGRVWRVDDGNYAWYFQGRAILAAARKFDAIGDTTDRNGETVYAYQRWCDSILDGALTVMEDALDEEMDSRLVLAAREVQAGLAVADGR